MNEKEIKRLIGHLKEGGELGRMPNSSIDLIIHALELLPMPCKHDCIYKDRWQKCTCCKRNSANLKDCYVSNKE